MSWPSTSTRPLVIGRKPAIARSTSDFLPMTAERVLRSEEHTSELQSPYDLVCRLLLEKKKKKNKRQHNYNNRTDRTEYVFAYQLAVVIRKNTTVITGTCVTVAVYQYDSVL